MPGRDYELSPLAREIRERRKKLQMTQDDLARQVSSNASYISRVETDTTGYPIEPDLIKRMEGALQCPPGALLAHDTWMGRRIIRQDEEPQLSKFALEIRKWREHKGWSQQILAEKIGLNASMVSKLESDSAGIPSQSTAAKLQQAFEMNDRSLEALASQMLQEKNVKEALQENGPEAVVSLVNTLRTVGQEKQVDEAILNILAKAQKEMEEFYKKK